MSEIAFNQLLENNIKPDKAAEEHLKTYISYMYEKKDKYFGNGRSVRKVIEEAVRNQHLRLSEITKAKRTQKMVNTLVLDDVKEFDVSSIPTSKSGIGFKRS